jgi:hypothetical protein
VTEYVPGWALATVHVAVAVFPDPEASGVVLAHGTLVAPGPVTVQVIVPVGVGVVGVGGVTVVVNTIELPTVGLEGGVTVTVGVVCTATRPNAATDNPVAKTVLASSRPSAGHEPSVPCWLSRRSTTFAYQFVASVKLGVMYPPSPLVRENIE